MKLTLNIQVEIDAQLDIDKESISHYAFTKFNVDVIEGNIIMNQIPYIISSLSSEMRKRLPTNLGDCLTIGGEIPKLKGIINEINEDKDFPPINQISGEQITPEEY